MKNQLLNLKMIALMCLMMVLGGANVWAKDVQITIDASKIADFASEYQEYSWTDGDISGKCYAYKNNSNMQFNSTPYVYNTSEVPGRIKSVKITKGGGKTRSWSVFMAGKQLTSNNYKSDGTQIGTSQTVNTNYTWTVPEGSDYNYFYITKGSGSTQISSIVITYEAAPAKPLTSLVISGQPTKTTYNVGEEFDPKGLVVTGTYDDNTTATITNGITWTKNPETMSLGNTSCTVTASVGEVKSEPFVVNGLNVVKAIVFDFTKDWEGITAIAPSNNGNQTNGEQVVAGKELKVDGVVMTATNGEDSYNKTYYTGLYKNNDGQNLRVYVKGSLTFTAPEGYNLSEISFTGDKFFVNSKEKFSATEKELTISNARSATWMGNAHAVTFNAFAGVQFETATIKLVAAAAKPTYTKQNLKFIAYTSEGYYATFSSDKVTFITSKHVIPHVVTVAKGKVDMKSDMFKSEKTTIESAEVDGYYIPANTGILLYSDAENADYYTVENKTVGALAEGTNMLKPAPANGGEFTAEKDDCKYYKLAYNDYTAHTGLGFYWGADNGGAFYVKAGTAYLAVPASDASAKGFAFNGEATGIEGVNANVENVKAIYNLNGQRVASMAKPGLYIVNGKKVVRK